MPFIGSAIVTPNLERVIRGKKGYQWNSSLFPVAQKAADSLAGFASLPWEADPEQRAEKFRKAAVAFAEAAGTYHGLPVSGIREAGRAFGIGDGDGEPEFNPGAFAGRR